MTSDVELNVNTILAILAERAGARPCLDAAGIAALALDHPTVTGLHIRVDPRRDILATEEMLLPEQERAMEIEAMAEGRALRNVFSAWTAGLDRHVHTSWLDITDGIDDEITALGKQAALNVVANLTPESRGHARAAFHACLFKTHRPLLVVPHGYTPRPLRRALIGWKDTPTGRRALDASLPWLRRMEEIRLVCIGRPDRLELDWAREFLADKEVKVAIVDVEREGNMSVGTQILEEARRFDADWLITGAYWHSELAEWILGGVTDALLRQATVPLFMCH